MTRIQRIRGHDALLTHATTLSLRKAGSANMRGDETAAISSRRALRSTIQIRHSPEEDRAIWVRMLNAGSDGAMTEGKYFSMPAAEALKIASKGSEEQKIKLAASTPHEDVQMALGRDSSPAVYDAVLSSKHLTAEAATKLMLRAKIGENFSAAAYLEGRINEMAGKTVRILPRQAAAANRISRRV